MRNLESVVFLGLHIESVVFFASRSPRPARSPRCRSAGRARSPRRRPGEGAVLGLRL